MRSRHQIRFNVGASVLANTERQIRQHAGSWGYPESLA